MTEMQTYYPVPEPVTAWQWDGKPDTTDRMLKRWADKIAYFPATPRHSLLSGKVNVEPHYLRIKRLPNNTWTTVHEGDYIVENQFGIYVSSKHRFEKGHQSQWANVTYPEVSRIEVIKEGTRDYVKYGFDGAMVAIQDEGRTIKVFAVTNNPKSIKLQDLQRPQ